ncbi:hypothetical protein HDU83_008062 [Entophlyctis luteolus]|nr:hypothetical protein HDU82_000363 [Entophlyctis luteolus]KAJ3357249.1 hypothetical protein HDU83_008062 [Entophlyctis luteolus]KAJ3394444.1 hypothetical protein HDU84_008440 [Entophlyctis sp. JEL0112]
MAPIKVGDKIPSGYTFMTTTNPEETNACAIPKPVKSEDIFSSGTVVLFAVPGAFTPTCHVQHLPGFAKHAAEFENKGVTKIYCTSTNDIFVLDAWGKQQKSSNVTMLADGNGAFAAAIGMDLDLSLKQMGSHRTKRYALIIKDGVVTYVGEGDVNVSGAEPVLANL